MPSDTSTLPTDICFEIVERNGAQYIFISNKHFQLVSQDIYQMDDHFIFRVREDKKD